MKNKTWLIGILLVGVLVLSGCTSKPTYSGDDGSSAGQTSAPATNGNSLPEVVTLDLFLPQMENWDGDAEVDGIEVTLQPRNKDDDIVKAQGTLTARAYTSGLDTSTFKHVKGELLQEWKNIPVGQDYGFLGTKVRLEFAEDYVSIGTLYVEFEFNYDGKTYNAVEDSVLDLS